MTSASGTTITDSSGQTRPATGGSSGVPDYAIDPSQLALYMQSEAGKGFAGTGVYNPAGQYLMGTGAGGPGTVGYTNTANGLDTTAFIQAFQSWQAGNQQTQQNWQNYSEAVAANGGGEGDQTITSGLGVSQRNQLLGALANAGNPTTPTPGLGSFGTQTARRK